MENRVCVHPPVLADECEAKYPRRFIELLRGDVLMGVNLDARLIGMGRRNPGFIHDPFKFEGNLRCPVQNVVGIGIGNVPMMVIRSCTFFRRIALAKRSANGIIQLGIEALLIVSQTALYQSILFECPWAEKLTFRNCFIFNQRNVLLTTN
ncbi:MAG: hypothetical protein JWL75_785 [Parcubacteria group bacterium]|nr:hypothetical protein [Parcubacteria group bacterium]